MLPVIYLSFATASIAFTITETKLFEPLRKWLDVHNAFLGKLFKCGYCLGHWMAFGLVAIYQPRLFISPLFLLDFFLTALVVAWFGGVQWAVMCWLVKTAEK